MNCTKGCKDRHDQPVIMQGGKIVSKKEGRYIRYYCPSCFHREWVPERRESST
jgi:hypothetical protein